VRTVERREITDYQTYEETREAFRRDVLRAKDLRRVHVGGHLTLLFENALTVRYQVQEMMRAERIVKERDVAHELATYNALLGGPGEIGATLLIEVDDPVERRERLARWRSLPAHLHLELEDGTRVTGRFDDAQADEEKLSAVQYVKFDVAGRVPVAVVCDHPALAARTALRPEQRAALAADLEAA
jgi:hypothetical protein